MSKPDSSLDTAYALETPEDSKRLYANWAESYEDEFATEMQYRLPDVTAREFLAAGGRGPVLDVGAGTGLLGVLLKQQGVRIIDATDISGEMLQQATKKDVYRDTIEADLTIGIPAPDGSYAGVVSSGTFTHGHVGPEVLPRLLRVARRDALFALSINTLFYHSHGFSDMFEHLLASGNIRKLTLPECRIYGPDNTGAHKDDTAFVALFRKS